MGSGPLCVRSQEASLQQDGRADDIGAIPPAVLALASPFVPLTRGGRIL